MKKLLVALVNTLLLAGCGSSGEREAEPRSLRSRTQKKEWNEPVFFQDAKLESAVRTALEKPEGTITGKEVASLVELVAEDLGIKDLSGLEHATNLTKLYLTGNQVTDVRPLAKLTNLRELWLVGNEIADEQQSMLKTALPGCEIKFWFGEF